MVGPFPDGTIDFIGFIRNNKHRFLLVTLVQCLNDLRAAELVDDGVMVINGDGRDIQLLMEEGIKNTEAFVALTGNSETNILACLAAKRMG